MAIDKNKKTLKKGAKKKTYDPISRKEWYQMKAPAPFDPQSFGYTCANRTQGLKNVDEQIIGRVVTAVQPDLAKNNDVFVWRKIKLIVDSSAAGEALTSFYGVDMTRDELCSLIKKRKTLIEAVQDCKSSDGYMLRVFVICFTRENANQKRKTSYAMASQQKLIRFKINKIVQEEISKSSATKLLTTFTSESLEHKISVDVSRIYPVENVKIRKVKVLSRPKIDKDRLSDMHNPEKRTLSNVNANKKGPKVKGPEGDSLNLVHATTTD